VWFPSHAFETSMPTTVKSGYDNVVDLTLTLTNTGTEDAVYRVEVEEVTDFGWPVQVCWNGIPIKPGENIPVGSGESAEITIRITIPETENDQLAEWTVTVTDAEQDFLVAKHTIRAFAEVPEVTPLPLPLDLILAAVVIVVAAGAGFALSRRGAQAPKRKSRARGVRRRR